MRQVVAHNLRGNVCTAFNMTTKGKIDHDRHGHNYPPRLA